ncbi:MAG: ribose 5-phosphate isomerase B [Ignavibacteriae bacterium]|nr:MAG: ribose 5-phosphate isomerase B [Ignavibacteriota bacterium]
MSKKRLVTENDILKIITKGNGIIELTGNELITPAAKDKIKEAKIKIVKTSEIKTDSIFQTSFPFDEIKTLAIGSDHTGYKFKEIIKKYLQDKNYNILDVGTNNEESCDYPKFAKKVAQFVKNGAVAFGIILDATGNPSAITANKIKGIRAANCFNEFTAKSAREHNNANILTLGAKALGEETIKSILDVWVKSKFLGERHQRRLDLITEIENLE